MNRYRYGYGDPIRLHRPRRTRRLFDRNTNLLRWDVDANRREVARFVAREVARSLKNAARTVKSEVRDDVSKNTYTAQVGMGGSIGAPVNSKQPMAGSIAATGSINVGVNNHGQIFVAASGAPMVGQGGGATVGVQYGFGFAKGGPTGRGLSVSTNHHVEGTMSIPEVPVAMGGSYDWNSQGRSGSAGSARFSAGQMMFYGGGEQVNYTYTFNNPPGGSE